MTKGRGFQPVQTLVEIKVVWLSPDPLDRNQPDVDNMLNPLIDTLNSRVIEDDRQVHRITAEKGNVNAGHPLFTEISDDAIDDQNYQGEVIIVRVSNFDVEFGR